MESDPPSDAVVPCLRLLLAGIVESLARKRKAGGRPPPDTLRDIISAERNVEFCVATLRALFSSEGFLDRMPAFAEADPDGWAAFRVPVPDFHSLSIRPCPHPTP
jgi:hypothetical protein